MPLNTKFSDRQDVKNLGPGFVQHVDAELDFTVNPITAGDTVNVLKIPKNAIVIGTDQIILTACTDAVTADFGDGTTANLYDNDVALNAAANTHTGTDPATETALAATNGKHYTADGYVVMTPSAALTNGKIWIAATYKLLNRPAA